MIISFGWTTPALLAGVKTVTRRDWAPQHAAKFKAGMLVDAWNTSPRNIKGDPHKVATIRLTQNPYLESASIVPSSDWGAEGFAYLSTLGLKVNGMTPEQLFDYWTDEANLMLYVVRFELVVISASLLVTETLHSS